MYFHLVLASSAMLCDFGIRAFSGSRDLPKDHIKAYGLFDYAKKNANE